RRGRRDRLRARRAQHGPPTRERRGWGLRKCKPPIHGRDDIGVDVRRASKSSAQPNYRSTAEHHFDCPSLVQDYTTPPFRPGLPTPSPLRCHLCPPLNDSHRLWISSRGPVTGAV